MCSCVSAPKDHVLCWHKRQCDDWAAMWNMRLTFLWFWSGQIYNDAWEIATKYQMIILTNIEISCVRYSDAGELGINCSTALNLLQYRGLVDNDYFYIWERFPVICVKILRYG